MNSLPLHHCTVLLHEAIEALAPKTGGIYVDGTYGRGGHTRLLLSKLDASAKVIVFDKDPQAIADAILLANSDQRVHVVHGGFAGLEETLNSLKLNYVDGILLDLGVSSPQIDEAARGFSFRNDGPLDMRMDPTRGESVAQWLSYATLEEIAEVIKNYGEERFAFKIAEAIITRRATRPLVRTHELATLVASCVRKHEPGKDPATRTFQALRIYINQELTQLSEGLEASFKRLATDGRLAIISFHSLEDRLVKQFMRKHGERPEIPRGLPIKECDVPVPPLEIMARIKPSTEEIKNNPRARSAILRVARRRNNESLV